MSRNRHPEARRRTHAQKAQRGWSAAAKVIRTTYRRTKGQQQSRAAAFALVCVSSALQHEEAARRAETEALLSW